MNKKQKKEIKKIIISLVMLVVLMIVEHTVTLPVPLDNCYVQMLFYFVPYFIVGRDVLKDCLKGIKNRQMFDESLLMTIATVGAFATGENSEAVAVMLFY